MHPKQRQQLNQNLNFLGKNSPEAHRHYLSVADRDCTLIYADGAPLAPTNFIYNDGLFYPTDARPYAKGHVLHHLEHVTPFKMPVLILDKDDPIVFRNLNSIETETALSILSAPNIHYRPDKLYCPTLFVFGLGLGDTVDELVSTLKPCNLILLETDARLLTAYLLSTDLQKLALQLARRGGRLSVHFNIDPGPCLQSAFDYALTIPNGQLNCFQAFVAHERNSMPFIIENFSKFAPQMLAGLVGYFNDERRQIVQTFENLMVHDRVLQGSWPAITDATAVVVGSGPSLDKTIAKLTEIKERVVIFACGSAITPLLKLGIVPDFYVELETHPQALDFIRLVEEFDIYKKTVFLGSTGVPADAYLPWLQKFLFVRDRSTSSQLFEPMFKPVKASWPMVGNAGISIATALGFRKILLMGIDCGMRHGDRHHAKESSYYDGKADEIEKANPLINTDNISDDIISIITDIEKQSILEIPSVMGDSVFAPYMLWYSHLYIENLFREVADMDAVQISEGARINYATNILPENFDPSSIGTKPADILGRLLERMVSLDQMDRTFIERARQIGIDGERIRRLISRQFEHPIKSMSDWLKCLGTAGDEFRSLRKPDCNAYNIIFGSYDKVTKTLTERALMIPDESTRIKFLQIGTGKLKLILAEMAESLKQLAPDLEAIRDRRQTH